MQVPDIMEKNGAGSFFFQIGSQFSDPGKVGAGTPGENMDIFYSVQSRLGLAGPFVVGEVALPHPPTLGTVWDFDRPWAAVFLCRAPKKDPVFPWY